ncbi:hypothetical protein [Paraliomyxa miuraensis]|uniref:hypothetical protein n=1 Tax=Paraliomyxa miuraensis TaxID=376150 RepID=UPI00225398A1|nr:hypothetical protein [Paraliomyxa miuraensis]MCX4239834.1 hypothetical protein [Paraliomyxa miuraensis]
MSASMVLMSLLLAASPPTPSASEDVSASEDDGPRPRDLEISDVVVMPTVTGPTVGPDLGVTVGRPNLHVRLGLQVVGGPDRTLSPTGHRVGEITEASTVHACAARGRRGFRVRLCGGGQIGVVHLRYRGFERAGHRAMPWGALSGFGDLNIPLGRRRGVDPDRVGLLLRGGTVIPVLGPAIVMHDVPGAGTLVRLPGSIGATFGAGLRVSLR